MKVTQCITYGRVMYLGDLQDGQGYFEKLVLQT